MYIGFKTHLVIFIVLHFLQSTGYSNFNFSMHLIRDLSKQSLFFGPRVNWAYGNDINSAEAIRLQGFGVALHNNLEPLVTCKFYILKKMLVIRSPGIN